MNDEINERIQKGVKWGSSRYEIDAGLLQDGYDPTQIESGWYTFEQPRPAAPQTSIKLPLAFGGMVVFVLIVLPLLSYVINEPLIALFVIWMVCLCIITVVGYLKNSDSTKVE
jgi:hypothetical protein